MKLRLLNAALLGAACLGAWVEVVCSAEPEWSQVERVGPPRFYSPPVERYRFGSPNVDDPAFYPIPKTPVIRQTYMAWLERSGMLDYVNQPKRGLSGLTQLLPSLAKFIQTGERRWGEACIAILQDFHRALEQDRPRS